MEAVWQVEIVKGDSELPPKAPVAFGTPQIAVGPTGVEEPGVTVPIILGPVAVRSHNNWIAIQTEDAEGQFEAGGAIHTPWVTHREMAIVSSIEFCDFGYVRVEGAEVRPDGSLGYAVWHIEPWARELVSDD